MAEPVLPPSRLPPLMPEPAARRHLCAAAQLPEKGQALVFDVLQYREPTRAFALRFDGRVVAYLNRCAHVPAEMDWQPGEFLDSGREFILCSIHGAAYDPLNGRCVAGPCGRGKLTELRVEEEAGEVYWYPSRDVQPAFED
jgi:nitrite reductase/ring-hydroxylating ferredoxin subunit